MASKFSSGKPSGSISLWQAPQVATDSWAVIFCRLVPVAVAGSIVFTFAGGSGICSHRMVCRMNFPRYVGEPSCCEA